MQQDGRLVWGERTRVKGMGESLVAVAVAVVVVEVVVVRGLLFGTFVKVAPWRRVTVVHPYYCSACDDRSSSMNVQCRRPSLSACALFTFSFGLKRFLGPKRLGAPLCTAPCPAPFPPPVPPSAGALYAFLQSLAKWPTS